MSGLDEQKHLVSEAAAQLRHEAIQDRYAGAGPPDIAFRLASVLDRLHIHWRDLDEDLREVTLAACRNIT